MPSTDRHLWEYPWFRDLLLLALLATAVWFLYRIQSIAVPLLIGFALAYAVNPHVTWAKRRLRLPRLASALLILLVVFAAVAALAVFILPSLISQAQTLAGRLGGYASWLGQRLGEQWTELVQRAQSAAGVPTTAPVAGAPPARGLGDIDLQTLGQFIVNSLGIGVGVVGTALGMGSYLILAAVIILFSFIVFVWNFQGIVDWFAQFVPQEGRLQTLHVVARIDRALSGFIRGRLLQAAIMGVVLAIGWKLASVPFWLLLAVVSAVMHLIPYAASLGCLAAVTLTIVDHMSAASGSAQPFTWGMIVWPIVVYVAAQSLDGWLIEPLVQGRATELHSLTIMLAVVAGGFLAGLLGMLLAIPVTACLKILGEELLLPRLRAYAQRPPST